MTAKVQNVDTVLNPRWIIPVEPPGAVLEDHALVIDEGRVEAVLPRTEAATRFSPSEEITLADHALIPGLVNTHTHAAMTLLRGLADDLPLMEWLNDHIWPAEGRWANAEFVRDGGELAVLEMVRGGITCFNDMYFFPEITADVARGCGMRASIGLIAIEFESAWARDATEYLDKGVELHRSLVGETLTHLVLAPHAPYTVADATFERVRRLSEELGLRVHIHLHETSAEVAQSIEEHGCRPLERMRRLGLLNSGLIAVHMTQVEDEEVYQLVEAGASVVHCPDSNLKLASGFCPTARLLAEGVNVAIGTDGAASNNDLDLFGEMRTAALLGKAVAGDAAALPAARVLRMATLDGARALGLGAELGSIEAGKWADAVAVDLGRAETQPVYDPVSQLVYAAGRQQVSDVWVAGRRLLSSGSLTTIDSGEVLRKARQWGKRIAGR